jgi:hypothetical protein
VCRPFGSMRLQGTILPIFQPTQIVRGHNT